ncbi:MAG: hypothetical protein VXW17_01500, partial [Pseudomonadota bacterium]|nr:hypothetical protein [Pseudomonadota bacterium]
MHNRLLAVLPVLVLVSCGPPPPPISYSPETGHIDFTPFGVGDYLRGSQKKRAGDFEAALRAYGPLAQRGD